MGAVFLALLAGMAAIAGTAAVSPGVTGSYYATCKTINGAFANSSSVSGCAIFDTAPATMTGVAGKVDFNNTLMSSGWDTITVVQDVSGMNGFANDAQKAYALGFAEGFITNARVENNYNNLIADVLPTPGHSSADAMYKWIDEHLDFLRSVAGGSENSHYTKTLSRLLAQLAGIADGYQSGCSADKRISCNAIGFKQIFYMNFAREFSDLTVAFNYNSTAAQKAAYKETLPDNLVGHCSAMIKPMADDVYVSHVTWSGYNTMMRVFKTYTFGGSNTVTFSSYNGLIFSQDDWYMTGAQLSVMETTNGVYNDALFVDNLKVNPKVVSSFLRVMISNSIAISSPNWAETFVRYNSGTYNNQWMILDMKIITPGTPFPKDAFWVVETLPILYRSGDVSEVINRQGYWGSYNTPYFTEIYEMSGNRQQYEMFGDFFSYTETTRAKIFARNQTEIKNLDDFKALMRYNNYLDDPLSHIPNCTGATNNTCDPVYSSMLAIAARGDLMPATAKKDALGNMWQYFAQRPHVGSDCKVTTHKYMTEHQNMLMADVIVGPTTYNGNPVFEWKNSPWVLKHDGLPTKYDFPFQQKAVKSVSSGTSKPEVDGVVRGVGYSIAAVGGATVVLAVIVLTAFAIKDRKAAKAAAEGGDYAQI